MKFVYDFSRHMARSAVADSKWGVRLVQRSEGAHLDWGEDLPPWALQNAKSTVSCEGEDGGGTRTRTGDDGFAIRCLSHLAMPPIGTEEHTRHAAGVNDGAALLANTFSKAVSCALPRESGRRSACSLPTAFSSSGWSPLSAKSPKKRTESCTECCHCSGWRASQRAAPEGCAKG